MITVGLVRNSSDGSVMVNVRSSLFSTQALGPNVARSFGPDPMSDFVPEI